MLVYKIGCYALLVTSALHLFGHFQEPVPQSETQEQLLELMKASIDTGAGVITMEGLQKGFSLCFSLLFLWSGVTSLFLARKFATDPSSLRKVSIINTLALIIGTTVSFIYFFAIPTACFATALLFFAISIFWIK